VSVVFNVVVDPHAVNVTAVVNVLAPDAELTLLYAIVFAPM
jgi:hypothetical protein